MRIKIALFCLSVSLCFSSLAQTDSTKINIKYNFITVYSIRQGNEPISIENFTRIAANNIQAVKLIKKAKKQADFSYYAGILAGVTVGFSIPFIEKWEQILVASSLVPIGIESYLEYKSLQNLKKAAELLNQNNSLK